MNPFEVYIAYLALKSHFTTVGYDYHKYNGKVKASVAQFEARNDKYGFIKLARKKDPFSYMLANILVDPSYHPYDYKDFDTDARYTNWVKRTESLSYIFENDLKGLDSDFNSLFRVKENEYPKLLTSLMKGNCSYETATILLDFTDAWRYIHRRLRKYGMAFSPLALRLGKYRPFLSFDVPKFRRLVIDRWSQEHAQVPAPADRAVCPLCAGSAQESCETVTN
jgi:hypothetical protein